MKMHMSRQILLLALAPIGAAIAGTAAPDDSPGFCSAGPTLPFYAYALHGGNQLAVFHGPDYPDYFATFGLVNLESPGNVLMENAGTLRLSRNNACTFDDLAAVEDSPLVLVAARPRRSTRRS
jgi:hypothetical protein